MTPLYSAKEIVLVSWTAGKGAIPWTAPWLSFSLLFLLQAPNNILLAAFLFATFISIAGSWKLSKRIPSTKAFPALLAWSLLASFLLLMFLATVQGNFLLALACLVPLFCSFLFLLLVGFFGQ